jgi:hypothetical protein
MSTKRVKPKGVFCIEGDWWGKVHRQSSVRPALELLHQWDPYYIPFVHRDVATRQEFEYYVRKWRQKGTRKYPILYLAFHGDPGVLYVGDGRASRNRVSLDDVADLLDAACAGRIIHFGSCGTLDLHGHRLNGFLKRTHALAICGFCDSILWLDSTAFDLHVFAAMQLNALTRSGARAMNTRIRSQHRSLAKRLGFRMIINR